MNFMIYGKNAVEEFLRSGGKGKRLLLRKGAKGLDSIQEMAEKQGFSVAFESQAALDEISEGGNHQGVILFAEEFQYDSIEDILRLAVQKGEDPFLVLLDGITDPHNLGAILRSCECCGVHGVVIPKHRSAQVNPTVFKTSSGAAGFVKVARVTNLNQTIELLKKKNIWIYGADAEGAQSMWDTDFAGGVALVIGSEGKGISKHTGTLCDVMVSIPMKGKLESLNASCSASVLMYEVLRGRREK